MIDLFLDEDTCDHRFTAALRAGGFDVTTVLELGRMGIDDEDQLAFAATDGRVIVSRNQRDFAELQSRWAEAGRSHPGIVIRRQDTGSPESDARDLLEFARSLAPNALDEAIHYL